MALFIVVALLVLGVAAFVNAIAKRSVLNGGRIAAVVVLLLMLIRIGVNLSNPDPDLGRRVGSVVGQAFWPLLLSVWMDRRHVARVKQGNQSGQLPKEGP